MCYQLYYNKEEVKIKVSILSNVFKHSFKIQETIERLKENEIWNYNSFYIFANNRKLLKLKGVFASILGIATSPIIAILIVANLLDKIMHISFIDGVFWGVNLSVIILIYLALKEMWQKSIIDIFSAFWFVLILTLSLIKISPIILIISSILFGIILHFLKRGKNA